MKPIEVKELVEYEISSLFGKDNTLKTIELLERKNTELCKNLRLHSDAIKIYKKNKKQMVQFSGISGVISYSNVEIEIMPKFLNAGIEWRESLFNMICIAGSRRIFAQQSSHMAKKQLTFYDHVAIMFIDEMVKALGQDTIHTYRDEEDSSRFLRGRLLMYAQLEHIITNAGTLYYEHDVFDTENEFNYILKWCAQSLEAKVKNNDIRNKLREIGEELPKVSGTYRIPVDAKLPPQYSHYLKALEIANNLASGYGSAFQKAEGRGMSYIVPMEVIYEKFIEKILKSLVSEKYSIKSEAQSSVLFAKAEYTDMKSYYTRPDNKIVINGKPMLLIDAKYKNNFVNNRVKKPINTDVYQIFASMVSHGCMKGILISPCESTESMYSRHWTIEDNGKKYTIYSLMLNISDISTVSKIRELKRNILCFIEKELEI
ncbi:MAG: McrC family protein [Clostridium sp.]|nr:McrC family protein [Clostridium sp.]